MTSMPYLIMQYKPYIVELPCAPTKEAYFKQYVAIALLALYIYIHLINTLTLVE